MFVLAFPVYGEASAGRRERSGKSGPHEQKSPWRGSSQSSRLYARAPALARRSSRGDVTKGMSRPCPAWDRNNPTLGAESGPFRSLSRVIPDRPVVGVHRRAGPADVAQIGRPGAHERAAQGGGLPGGERAGAQIGGQLPVEPGARGGRPEGQDAVLARAVAATAAIVVVHRDAAIAVPVFDQVIEDVAAPVAGQADVMTAVAGGAGGDAPAGDIFGAGESGGCGEGCEQGRREQQACGETNGHVPPPEWPGGVAGIVALAQWG